MATVSTWPKIEYGNATGKPTVVFLAGFPDDQESPWGDNLRRVISEEYHAVFLCLPGFEKNGKPRPWGYNFDQLIDMLHATIEQVTQRDEQIFLVGHDWGAILAMRYQNKFPSKVRKLALMDVGMLSIKTATPSQLGFILMYQMWYAFCYVLSQILSQSVAFFLVNIFSLAIFAPLFVGLEEGKERMKDDKDVVLRCYVYFQLWKSVLTGKLKDPKMPTCPVLFLYGENKLFMFHSKQFLVKLDSRSDCSYRALPCGHWVGIKEENTVLRELQSFFPKQ